MAEAAYREEHPPGRTGLPHTPARTQGAALCDLRFSRLMAREDWEALPAATRRRFTKRLRGGDSAVYRGEVCETVFSPLGRVLAEGLRLIGAPLPTETPAPGTPAIVTVTEDRNHAGQYWTRQYNRRTGFPQVIHSSKVFCGETGLEERVGAGIGMTLRLKRDGHRLLFVSARYFWRIFGLCLTLPRWLEPGELVVGHEDHGDGSFDFTLRLTHPVFGELLRQRAHFRDMA